MKFYFLALNYLLFSLQRFFVLAQIAQSCESEMNWGNQKAAFFSNTTLYKFVTDNDDELVDTKYELDADEFRQKFISSCSARASNGYPSSLFTTIFSDYPSFRVSRSYKSTVTGYGFAKLCREDLFAPSLEFEQCIRKVYDNTIKPIQEEQDTRQAIGLGLGVGISGLLLLGIVIGIFYYHVKCKKSKTSTPSTTDLQTHDPENIEEQNEEELTTPEISS